MSLRMRNGFGSILLAALLSMVFFVSPASAAHTRASATHPLTSPAPQLEVSHPLNGTIVNKATQQPVILHGVDREETPYLCDEGKGIFKGPLTNDGYSSYPDMTDVNAMLSWDINVVRIPLNEDCWLGINLGTDPWAGLAYRTAMQNYVNELTSNGINVILDLQYTAPGSYESYTIEQLPDADHAGAFWAGIDGVATMFGGNDAVIFDAFNEPDPPDNSWNCWLEGTNGVDGQQGCGEQCTYVTQDQQQKILYDCLGMQAMVDDIRGATTPGPDNIIMLGGTNYSKWFDGWFTNLPQDPDGNLVADGHTYCTCGGKVDYQWNQNELINNVLDNNYPVIAGEIGEEDLCADNATSSGHYITQVMTFLDSPGKNGLQTIPAQSYLVWAWAAGSPGDFHLITDHSSYSATQDYGQTTEYHFQNQSYNGC